jgi:hypothetical protein
MYLKQLNKGTNLAAALVCLFALSAPSLALLTELLSRKWSTPLQPKCLVEGYALGALLGLVLGTIVFYTALIRNCTWSHSVAAICLASPVAGVLGAIAAFRAIGLTIWPPEMVYGVDADILIIYGFIAGATFAASCILVLTAIRKSPTQDVEPSSVVSANP